MLTQNQALLKSINIPKLGSRKGSGKYHFLSSTELDATEHWGRHQWQRPFSHSNCCYCFCCYAYWQQRLKTARPSRCRNLIFSYIVGLFGLFAFKYYIFNIAIIIKSINPILARRPCASERIFSNADFYGRVLLITYYAARISLCQP